MGINLMYNAIIVMKTINCCLFLSIVVLSMGCCNDAGDSDSIRINLASCTEAKYPSPSDVYGIEPRYIKLVNADSADYAIQTIGKLVIRHDMIYISDERGLSLTVFDMHGNPVHKMDFRGRGPNEYLMITDFDVDDDGNIWVVDARKNAVFKYSEDLLFLHSKPFKHELRGIHCVDGSDSFLFQLANYDGHEYTHTMLAVSDTSLQIKQELLKYPKNKDDNFAYSTCISRGKSSLFFLYPTDYHLYEMNSDGSVRATFFLDYGEQSVPERYRKQIENHYEEIERDFYVILNFYRLTDSYLTFGVSHDGWYSAIMNRVTNEISYFDYNESAFSMVGQCPEGSVWQLTEGVGFETLPSDIREWILAGNDVLAIYPDK